VDGAGPKPPDTDHEQAPKRCRTGAELRPSAHVLVGTAVPPVRAMTLVDFRWRAPRGPFRIDHTRQPPSEPPS
jgi:hypothetical protein